MGNAQNFDCDNKLRVKTLLIILALSAFVALSSLLDEEVQSDGSLYVLCAIPIVAFFVSFFGPQRYEVHDDKLVYVSRFWSGRVKSVKAGSIIQQVNWWRLRMLYIASRGKCRILWPVINVAEFETVLQSNFQLHETYTVPRRAVYRSSIYSTFGLISTVALLTLMAVFTSLFIGTAIFMIPLLIIVAPLITFVVMIRRNQRIERTEFSLIAYNVLGRKTEECEIGEGVDFSMAWPFSLTLTSTNLRSSIPIYRLRKADLFYDLFAVSSGTYIFVDSD